MRTEHSKKLEDILKDNESLETKNISKKRKEDINEFINFKDNRENYYFLWNTTYDLLKEDNFIPESDLATIKVELDSEFNAYAN